MSVDIWYSTESTYDGGNVQISTRRWRRMDCLIPDGGYPDDVYGLDNEPGYTGTSGDGDNATWETANFNLGNYSSQDVKFKFRFGSDSSVNGYEGWYIDNFKIITELILNLKMILRMELVNGKLMLLSEWNYYSKDEEYGKSYSGDYAWYLGNTETGYYSASLNDSLETPTIDLGDGSEKYVLCYGLVWNRWTLRLCCT